MFCFLLHDCIEQDGLFYLFFKIYSYFTHLRAREISRQNMRNSENIVHNCTRNRAITNAYRQHTKISIFQLANKNAIGFIFHSQYSGKKHSIA